MNKKLAITLSCGLAGWMHTSSWAWDVHVSLMPKMNSILQDPSFSALDQPLNLPCPSDDEAEYAKLAQELHLNPHPRQGIKAISTSECKNGQQLTTGRQILAQYSVDEPDFGMDQELPGDPRSFDPDGFQTYMGGTTGTTSQGFRHMYFGGWQFWHPINTFQVPFQTIGLAPFRAELMANKAKALLREGQTNPLKKAWAFRMLGWSLHYVQDLGQPFHSTQIPHLRMVNFGSIFHGGFSNLVKETTRTISNFHFAYEEYNLLALTNENSPYAECIQNTDQVAPLASDPYRQEALKSPLILAERIAKSSVRLAPEVGLACVHFFGEKLLEPGVDLPRNVGTLNYAEMLIRPDLVQSRAEIHTATCKALANSAWASRALIQWVLSK